MTRSRELSYDGDRLPEPQGRETLLAWIGLLRHALGWICGDVCQLSYLWSLI
jgi:hypothetical protein